MNFFNRLTNQFSTIPATSPASSTSSSSPSRSFIPPSTSVLSQTSSIQSLSMNLNPLNLFGRSNKRITTMQNNKANSILGRLYPNHLPANNQEYKSMRESTSSGHSESISTDRKEDHKDPSHSLVTSATTEESSLSLDLNLIHSKDSTIDPREYQSLPVAPVIDFTKDYDDSTSEEEVLQGTVRMKEGDSSKVMPMKQSPYRSSSSKISPIKVPIRAAITADFPSNDPYYPSQPDNIPITKNLRNTNSILINRKEFDVLLTQKLEIEQKRVSKQQGMNQGYHGHGLISTFSPSDKPKRKVYNSSVPPWHSPHTTRYEDTDEFNIFYCPEGITRVPFQYETSEELKKISKSARLSSLYLKYDPQDHDDRDKHTRSTSNSTAMTTDSSNSMNYDYYESYKQRMLKRNYGELEAIESSKIYFDVPFMSEECGPTPTNSPNSSKARKYFK